MVGSFAVMATKKFKRVYLAEWRNHAKKMTQKELAELLGVTDVTVSRWEGGSRKMDVDDLASIAAVISKRIQYPVEAEDLLRHPNTLSLDSMLRGSPEALKKQAEAIIRAIKGSEGQK